MTTSGTGSWPTLTPETGRTRREDSDVRWETVKTEEEEYLDKLQSKLSRVMAGQYSSHDEDRSISNTCDAQQSQDIPSDLAAVTMPADNDEGLHLLYEYSLSTSPGMPVQHPNNSQTRPDSSTPIQSTIVTQAHPIKVSQRTAEEEPVIQGDIEDSPTGRRRTIRFRSRVRITSGIRAVSTSTSSSCGSASSSISAPLRGSESYDSLKHSLLLTSSAKTSIAPLSEMLPAAATNEWLTGISKAGRKRRRGSRESSSSYIADERTPLTVSRRRSYTEPTNEADGNDHRLQRAHRKTEEQVMFGKWPWRLFSWQWWWWKFEPIVCCCDMFDDESDLG